MYRLFVFAGLVLFIFWSLGVWHALVADWISRIDAKHFCLLVIPGIMN